MKKILIINSVCGIRSTGRIAADIALEYERKGYEVKVAYGRESVPEDFRRFAFRIGSEWEVRKNAIACRLLDNDGFAARAQTKRFLRWADEFNPDELWLHNLHGYYINVEMLFAWIKSRPQMKVFWTLHDCWTFTGHCAYFSYVGCEKWKYGCETCPLKKGYPSSWLFDRSNNNYRRKKRAFTGVEDLVLITPSFWLENLVRESFLRDYLVETRHNTIDTNTFCPTPSDFRERYSLESKRIVLGVASSWSERKGLNDFIRLSEMLDDSYRIVLVGLNTKQIRGLPKNILGLPGTNGKKELAEIYSTADIFLNPSKEETFGLTTLEAISCGTNAIVLSGTACEEVANLYGGVVVSDDVTEMKRAIIDICEHDR